MDTKEAKRKIILEAHKVINFRIATVNDMNK